MNALHKWLLRCDYVYIHKNRHVAHMYTFVTYMLQDGISPLFAASSVGQTEVVDTLLKSGADPNLV